MTVVIAYLLMAVPAYALEGGLGEDSLMGDGNAALQVGWGCPFVEPIQAIRGQLGSEVLGYINYFLPISEMAGILSVWLISIAAYYLASPVLRWIKALS
jgi:hypothetical protein